MIVLIKCQDHLSISARRLPKTMTMGAGDRPAGERPLIGPRRGPLGLGAQSAVLRGDGLRLVAGQAGGEASGPGLDVDVRGGWHYAGGGAARLGQPRAHRGHGYTHVNMRIGGDEIDMHTERLETAIALGREQTVGAASAPEPGA
jgi:hypothetical protein